MFEGSADFSDASAPFGVLREEEVNGEEVLVRDKVGNRSLVVFGSGDEISVQAGDEGVRFLLGVWPAATRADRLARADRLLAPRPRSVRRSRIPARRLVHQELGNRHRDPRVKPGGKRSRDEGPEAVGLDRRVASLARDHDDDGVSNPSERGRNRALISAFYGS